MSVQDTDHGYRELVEKLYGLSEDKPTVSMGIHEAKGSATHGKGPATIIDIANFNEFGTSRIPARSFIGDWFDEDEPKMREDLLHLMQSAVAGKMTADEALEILGQTGVGRIQQRISAGIEPANSESTIHQKGSSKPLVNKGILRSSIDYEVKK
jgi:hypothetical protein